MGPHQRLSARGLELQRNRNVLGGDGAILTKAVDTDPRTSIACRLKDILATRPN